MVVVCHTRVSLMSNPNLNRWVRDTKVVFCLKDRSLLHSCPLMLLQILLCLQIACEVYLNGKCFCLHRNLSFLSCFQSWLSDSLRTANSPLFPHPLPCPPPELHPVLSVRATSRPLCALKWTTSGMLNRYSGLTLVVTRNRAHSSLLRAVTPLWHWAFIET